MLASPWQDAVGRWYRRGLALDIGILGPLEVRDGGTAVRLGGTKQRALLALLVLHANEVLSSERIAEELWADDQPDDAPMALQSHVSRLRKALPGGSEILVTQAPGYVLRVAAEQVDLLRFERRHADGREALERGDVVDAAALLHEALSMWRGRPMADLENEPFARDEIARLADARLAAVEARIDADLALGRHDELVPELRALVRDHPLRERLRGQLMLALYRAGRQAEALEEYADARRVLVDGLGLEPSPRLNQLQRAILAHDEALLDAREETEDRVVVVVVVDEIEAIDALAALLDGVAARGDATEALVVQIPPPEALAAATATLAERRARFEREGIAVRVAAFSSREPGMDIVRLAQRESARLVIADIGADGLAPEHVTLLGSAPCDVLLVARGGGPPRSGPVLVPFGGSDHDWAALELGAWVATGDERPLRVMGAASDDPDKRDASRLLADASLVLQRATGVIAEPLLTPPGRGGIAAAAGAAGVLIVGLSERWREDGLGQTRSALLGEPPCPLVFAARGAGPGALRPAAPLTRFPWSVTRRILPG